MRKTQVIYTSGPKVMEHGGFGEDDTHVPIVVYSPYLKGGKVVSDAVATTQVAPTILQLLDQDPNALQACTLPSMGMRCKVEEEEGLQQCRSCSAAY